MRASFGAQSPAAVSLNLSTRLLPYCSSLKCRSCGGKHAIHLLLGGDHSLEVLLADRRGRLRRVQVGDGVDHLGHIVHVRRDGAGHMPASEVDLEGRRVPARRILAPLQPRRPRCTSPLSRRCTRFRYSRSCSASACRSPSAQARASAKRGRRLERSRSLGQNAAQHGKRRITRMAVRHPVSPLSPR